MWGNLGTRSTATVTRHRLDGLIVVDAVVERTIAGAGDGGTAWTLQGTNTLLELHLLGIHRTQHALFLLVEATTFLTEGDPCDR